MIAFLGEAPTRAHRKPRANLLRYKSSSQNRTCKGSNTAELLAQSLQHTVAMGQSLLLEELGIEARHVLFCDNYGLHGAIHSFNPQLTEWRYMPLLKSIREDVNPRDVGDSKTRALCWWIDGGSMPADCLTKHVPRVMDAFYKTGELDLQTALQHPCVSNEYSPYMNGQK